MASPPSWTPRPFGLRGDLALPTSSRGAGWWGSAAITRRHMRQVACWLGRCLQRLHGHRVAEVAGALTFTASLRLATCCDFAETIGAHRSTTTKVSVPSRVQCGRYCISLCRLTETASPRHLPPRVPPKPPEHPLLQLHMDRLRLMYSESDRVEILILRVICCNNAET